MKDLIVLFLFPLLGWVLVVALIVIIILLDFNSETLRGNHDN